MSLGKMSLPCRDKYWDELDAAQKIEKLGFLVEQLTYSLAHARSELDRMLGHRHVGGKLMVELGRGCNPLGQHHRGGGPLNKAPVLVER